MGFETVAAVSEPAPEGRPKRASIALPYVLDLSHTYCCSLFHCVLSTRDRRKLIAAEIQPRLWAYEGGIAKNHAMTALAVGGIEDHAHMLLLLPSTLAIAIAKAMEQIKSSSPRWMYESRAVPEFEWQEGYARSL